MNNKGSLICLDTSTYWLNLAKKQLRDYKNVNFINHDIRKADIKNNYFDIIYINYVIHDINLKVRKTIIEAIANKLKENGKLYIGEPTKEKHGIAEDEIIYLMKKAGLKLEESIDKKSSFKVNVSKNRSLFMVKGLN